LRGLGCCAIEQIAANYLTIHIIGGFKSATISARPTAIVAARLENDALDLTFSVDMKDEISRLRGMREAALEARALSRVLDNTGRRDSAQARSALLCWRIVRIATGRLRAHPYTSHESIPSPALPRTLMTGFIAAQRRRRMGALLGQLQSLCRVLDDTRALTLSPDLSDALGRVQAYMRPLVEEIAAKARLEIGGRQDSAAATESSDRSSAPSTSPYLAL
jgi:hypothetical protein